MGIDGTQLAVADSPENRTSLGNQSSPFPRMQGVLLAELGTHAVVDAIPATCGVGENRLVRGLLRSLSADMLVLLDRGFFSFWLLAALRERGTQVLGRLASTDLLGRPGKRLKDGSVLVTLTSKDHPAITTPLTVRVLSYRLHPQAAAALQQV